MSEAPGRLRLAVAAAAGLVVGSCTGSAAARPPAPAPPPVVELTMDEYRYDLRPATVAAGRVVFRLRNRGDQPHQPILITLPEDLPPLAEHLKGESPVPVDTVASNPGFRPGITGAIAVDLKAGLRYAFICSLRTADDKKHSDLGMALEFRAGGADGSGATKRSR